MVIGFKIGLAALRTLDSKGWFDVNCCVNLRQRPPDSCIIDGIQSSSGCTMEKHNITVEEREGLNKIHKQVKLS